MPVVVLRWGSRAAVPAVEQEAPAVGAVAAVEDVAGVAVAVAVAAVEDVAGVAVAVAVAAVEDVAGVAVAVAVAAVDGRPMIISIASGKGGTGKTLVATSLALLWAKQGLDVTYIDADVEEPNGHLFLNPEILIKERFGVPIPTLGTQKCGGHAECQRICSFNAIISSNRNVVVFPELCHSCGACVYACPESFLQEESRAIGTTSIGSTEDPEIGFVSGGLNVGEARAVPLIERVVDLRKRFEGPIIIDSPPGTSCNVKAAIEHADLALLVTEPTPFGLHDLELAVGLADALDVRTAAVINRSDIGNGKVHEFIEGKGIPLLAEIPFEWTVATAYAKSQHAFEESTSFRERIADLGSKLLELGGNES
jgi:MinD superfamily P-loop ATPase